MKVGDRRKRNEYGRCTTRQYGGYVLFHFGGDYYGFLDNDNLLHYLPHTYKSENSAMAGLADFKKAGNSRMRNLVWQGDDPKKLIDGGE